MIGKIEYRRRWRRIMEDEKVFSQEEERRKSRERRQKSIESRGGSERYYELL
jgi:hypothetical protein